MDQRILDHIPQRDPFLFIEKIVEHTSERIVTSKLLTGKEEFFKGHFPGRPVFPGVLMCEAVFQTGALLMSLRGSSAGDDKTALVTRIQSAKFKNMVKPGDELHVQVDFVEMLANAAFMKGKITCESKTVMTIEFAATLVDSGVV
jgi:3-hydroxyacyl-[acyl-carrier-protein] dehydratase